MGTLAALRDTAIAVDEDVDDDMSVTRSWFETWNRGDLDGFIDLYAPDAQMTPPASWVEAGTLEGRPAIRRFFEGLKEAWEGEDVAILHEVFRAGDRVVSRMDWQVRGRVSGIDTHLGITNVNTIRDGRIVRQQHYLDHEEALKDLGLPE
jgi:ketosteroid isomerase-like protein